MIEVNENAYVHQIDPAVSMVTLLAVKEMLEHGNLGPSHDLTRAEFTIDSADAYERETLDSGGRPSNGASTPVTAHESVDLLNCVPCWDHDAHQANPPWVSGEPSDPDEQSLMVDLVRRMNLLSPDSSYQTSASREEVNIMDLKDGENPHYYCADSGYAVSEKDMAQFIEDSQLAFAKPYSAPGTDPLTAGAKDSTYDYALDDAYSCALLSMDLTPESHETLEAWLDRISQLAVSETPSSNHFSP